MAKVAVPGFLPSTSGFHFSNSSFPPVPDLTINVLGQNIAIGDASNGLCGGMVYAARDYFQAGVAPPPDTNAPGSGPIFNFIVERLFDSFDLFLPPPPAPIITPTPPFGPGPLTYMWLMDPALPDHETFASNAGLAPHGRAYIMIVQEWPKIKADLDSGVLSPLGLVEVKSLDPTQMKHDHQVLAYAYELNGTVLQIWIYDPNLPGNDNVTLTLDIRDPQHTTLVTDTAGDTVCCFFRSFYLPASPPGGGWASLGGGLTSAIAVAANADGRLEVFVRGTDSGLYHKWQTAPGGGWSGWNPLAGVLTSDPTVGTNADGRLEVFVRGTDNALYHNWQMSPNGGWSGWNSLGGGLTSDPVVGRNADGRLEVFVRGTDNGLYHIWQITPGGGWSAWNPLGGGLTSNPAVGANADGRLEVFVRGTDNGLYHIWQITPGGGWSGWNPLAGGLTSNPSVGVNADGRLEVFVRGLDNGLYHIWQTAPSGGWSGWNPLGGGLNGDPVVGRNADGRLEVFVWGTDNALYHNWQTAPSGGWSGWNSLGGGLTESPTLSRNADGRLEVFVRGADNGLWHRWQTTPGGVWD